MVLEKTGGWWHTNDIGDWLTQKTTNFRNDSYIFSAYSRGYATLQPRFDLGSTYN